MENKKYPLISKEILDACEYEEDYTDAWDIVEKTFENINTIKGFYKDYGKGKLDEFFDKLNEFYGCFVCHNKDTHYHFWLSDNAKQSIELYVKTATIARINYDEDVDQNKSFEVILRGAFPKITEVRIDSLMYLYRHTKILREDLFNRIDRQLDNPETNYITLEEPRADDVVLSLSFPKTELY